MDDTPNLMQTSCLWTLNTSDTLDQIFGVTYTREEGLKKEGFHFVVPTSSSAHIAKVKWLNLPNSFISLYAENKTQRAFKRYNQCFITEKKWYSNSFYVTGSFFYISFVNRDEDTIQHWCIRITHWTTIDGVLSHSSHTVHSHPQADPLHGDRGTGGTRE